MSFCRDRVPNFLNVSRRANQKCASYDSLERPAHEFFQAPRAVRVDHFVVGIAQKRKIEPLLRLEALQSLHRIGACANYRRAGLCEFFLGVTKLGRFGCSTGSIGFRKEKQHQMLALKVFQREFFTFIGKECEIRGLITDFEHVSNTSAAFAAISGEQFSNNLVD